ncbi:redoxin domain-containing protein [Candidatus Poribacteria bacterium]|nr:redoxin domain-containing protein [Candidatus Poribacteria bacterium]
MSRYIISITLVISLLIGLVSAEKEEATVKIDETVKEWSLKDTENNMTSFTQLREDKKSVEQNGKDKNIIVLVFMATQCPAADDYVERILKLYEDYKEKKVQFVGIHSNKHETIDEIKKYQKKYKFEFPILIDTENKLADYFQARRTPEVFLIDESKILRYRGGIDDSRKTPKIHYLSTILKYIIDGKPIPEKEKKTRAIGCTIKRVRKTGIDRTP